MASEMQRKLCANVRGVQPIFGDFAFPFGAYFLELDSHRKQVGECEMHGRLFDAPLWSCPTGSHQFGPKSTVS